MNKILKLTIVLFLVCAIVAGVLGVVNELTKDTIAEQQRIKTERAYAAVLASDGYAEVDFDKAASLRPPVWAPTPPAPLRWASTGVPSSWVRIRPWPSPRPAAISTRWPAPPSPPAV